MGATVAVFTVVNTVLLRPLPYTEAGRLVRLESAVPGLDPGTPWNVGKAQFLFLKEHASSFEQLGIYRLLRATVGPGAATDQQAERVFVSEVSAGLLEVVGVAPLLGRAPYPDDNLAQTPSVAWLGHAFWLRRFGGDRSVLGRTLSVDGVAIEIAGVLPQDAKLPEELRFSEITVDLWIPIWLDPAAPPAASHVFRAIARLRPEVSLAAARTELAHLTGKLSEALPEAYSADFMRKTGFSSTLTPLHDDIVGGTGRLLWILFGSTALVLLVACANVSNLLLAYAASRRPQTRTQLALGASRGCLAGQFLVESFLLTGTAALLGLALAHWSLRILTWDQPHGLPRLAEIRLGWSEAALAGLLALVAGLIFGLIGLAGSGGDRRSLQGAERGVAAPVPQQALRGSLVVGQIALSVVLLACAALLVQSFRNLTSIRTGLDPEGVLTSRLVLPATAYPSFEAAGRFYRDLAMRLEALPRVETAAFAVALPLTGYDGCSTIFVEGRPIEPDEQPPCLPIFAVSPGYFRALGIPIRGESPDWNDLEQRAGLVLVSEALSERLWSDVNPIDKWLRASPGGAAYRVVGVAGDVRANGLDRPPTEAVYFPLFPPDDGVLWDVPRDVALVVRAGTESPDTLFPAIRQVLARLDPDLPLTDPQPLESLIAESTARTSFLTLLLGAASAATLLLSATGVYGLLSYLITQRRQEIGLRMAMGARPWEVTRLVLRSSLRLAAAGVVVGLVAALVTTHFLQLLLFEVSASDPRILGAVAGLVILVAALASYAPARRAARVRPAEVLRAV